MLRFACLVALVGLVGAPAWAAEISVTSDRDPVSLEDSFDLIFSADESPDGEPDFTPLTDDFEILRQGQSTQVNMINGRLNRRTEWTVTVIARRAGDLTVPAIRFGDDQSRPFALTVLPGRARRPADRGGDALQLEVDAEPKNPYVQAQVIFTIRLLHRVALRNGQLEDPKLADAMIQKLGEDRRYQTERDGQRYGVIERRFAIFPQKSGPLRIEPIALEAELAGGGSMFDQFFGGQSRISKIRSDAVTLQVRPIPAAFQGRHWLPAADLTLKEAWSSDPPTTKVGEPLTRTLSVRGTGVTMGMLPELSDRSNAADLNQYPDQPALSEEPGAEGLVGVRREKTALIPMKDGAFTVPGVEIRWWNTKTDKLEIARIPESTVTALPSAQPTPANPPVDELDVSGLAPHPPEVVRDTAPSTGPVPLTSNPWFWATWACALGWLATVLIWLYRTRGHAIKAPTTIPHQGPAISEVLKQLKKACADRDADAARRALLVWGAARWPSAPPANLEQLASRLGGEASVLIASLHQALYGSAPGEWNSDGLYALFADHSRDRSSLRAAGRSPEALEALYRT